MIFVSWLLRAVVSSITYAVAELETRTVVVKTAIHKHRTELTQHAAYGYLAAT